MPDAFDVQGISCPNCGSAINSGTSVCPTCGAGMTGIMEAAGGKGCGAEGPGEPGQSDLSHRISSLECTLEEIQRLLSQGKKTSDNNYPEYIGRLLDYMPTYYVTLVSVIQVIALGLLFTTIYEELADAIAGTIDPIWTVLIAGMFFIIMSIWITYTRTTSTMRLIPETLDGVIPFFFGLTEAIPIYLLALHELAWFYLSLSACAMVAIVQYIHTFRQLRLHHRENREVLEKIGPWEPRAILMAGIRAFLFILFGLIEIFFLLHSLLLAIIFLFLNIGLLFFLNRSLKVLSDY